MMLSWTPAEGVPGIARESRTIGLRFAPNKICVNIDPGKFQESAKGLMLKEISIERRGWRMPSFLHLALRVML